MKLRFLIYQRHKTLLKTCLSFCLLVHLSSVSGAQNILSKGIFRPGNQLFQPTEMAKKGCHYVECYGIQIDFEKSVSSDTTEWYYASFDALFRTVRELFRSSDEEISTEFVYTNEKTQKITMYAFKERTGDRFYTPNRKVTECFNQGLKISARTEAYNKRRENLEIYDTVIYNDHRLPVLVYQLWIDKSTLIVDTLMTEYIYDSVGSLVETRLHPVGDMTILLKQTGGCATTLFVNDRIDYPCNASDGDTISRSTLLGRLGFYEYPPLANREPELFKINDRIYDISIEIFPKRRILKANLDWVEDRIYLKDSTLPQKITVLYGGDTLVVYRLNYSNQIPSRFK